MNYWTGLAGRSDVVREHRRRSIGRGKGRSASFAPVRQYGRVTSDTQPTVLPTRDDPLVAQASEAIGGPPGEHATDPGRRGVWLGRWWTPLRIVLALTMLVLALHWIQKSPCNEGAWNDLLQYRKACYSDVYALYYAEKLNEGAVPYRDHPVEYPVVTGFLMATIGLPIHATADDAWFGHVHDVFVAVGVMHDEQPNEAAYFYLLTSLVLAACALVTAWAIVKLRPRRPFDAAMFAVAPALLVTATVNWDLWAISFATLFILFWSRQKLGWAGVMLGIAAAAKFYPLLFLGPLLLLCLRGRRMPEFFITACTAVITWVAVNLPVVMLWDFDNWAKFYTFSQERGVDWGTFWYIGSNWPLTDPNGFSWFRDLGGDIPALNNLTTVLFIVCCAGVGLLALLAPRRPRLSALLFLIVALFLLTNKVWSQQFVLWLLPLAVLARPRWGAFLAWQAGELLYFLCFYQIMLHVSGGDSMVEPEAFTWAALARWWSLAILCGFVVRDILKPEKDPVRSPGGVDVGMVDDPDGGVLDGARDSVLPWSPRPRRSSVAVPSSP